CHGCREPHRDGCALRCGAMPGGAGRAWSAEDCGAQDPHAPAPARAPGTAMTPIAITIKEAARLLAVSERTIRRMLDAGELDAVKIRGATRVLYASLENLCHTKRATAPTGTQVTSTRAAKELDAQLALRIGAKRRRSKASGAPKSTSRKNGAHPRVIPLKS